jgi:acetyl esterase/lipase
VYHVHGGGYTSGSCVTHRDLAARLSQASGARVFLLDYRLAPEHPFPAAIDDAVAGYEWLLAGGARPQQIVISGDSAGGTLVLAALLRLRERAAALPAGAVLISAMTDLTLSGASIESRAAADPLVYRESLAGAIAHYLGPADPRDPLASPLFADLRGLPALLIQVGADEVLLDDSTRLAERARAAGVQVTLEVWEAMWHVWHGWAAELPEARQAIARIGAFVRERT